MDLIPTPQRVIDRAFASLSPEGDCLVSSYSTGSHGYCQIGWSEGGKTHMRLVHRVVWEHANGVIPDDLTVDHTCLNQRCSRIDHLRLLTRPVNASLNRNHRKTHCKRGHEFTEVNIYRDARGHRVCRACTLAAQGQARRRRSR